MYWKYGFMKYNRMMVYVLFDGDSIIPVFNVLNRMLVKYEIQYDGHDKDINGSYYVIWYNCGYIRHKIIEKLINKLKKY